MSIKTKRTKTFFKVLQDDFARGRTKLATLGWVPMDSIAEYKVMFGKECPRYRRLYARVKSEQERNEQ